MSEHDPILQYAQRCREALGSGRPLEQALPEMAEALRPLLAHKSLLRERYSIPRRDEFGTYLLHEDPDYGFVITALVHRPGHRGRIHNHGVWTIYGNLEHEELIRLYERVEGDANGGRVEMREIGRMAAQPGDVHIAFADSFHVEENHLDVPSVACVIRECNLGEHDQERYEPEKGRVIRFKGVKALPWDQDVERLEPGRL